MTEPIPQLNGKGEPGGSLDALALHSIKKPVVPLTSAQKLATASQLYWSARELKTRYLKRLHPDWSETQVQTEVRRIFMQSSGLNR